MKYDNNMSQNNMEFSEIYNNLNYSKNLNEINSGLKKLIKTNQLITQTIFVSAEMKNKFNEEQRKAKEN